jgi:hypothetical protein
MAVDAVGMKVNAISIETAAFNDLNATTESEDHRETPETSSAPTRRAPDAPPAQKFTSGER